MNREEATQGMKVVFFGANDPQRTLGEIIKLNPARAKVRSLEVRSQREARTIWNVPYHLMEPASFENGSNDS